MNDDDNHNDDDDDTTMMTMKKAGKEDGTDRTKKLYSLSVVVAAVHLVLPEEDGD